MRQQDLGLKGPSTRRYQAVLAFAFPGVSLESKVWTYRNTSQTPLLQPTKTPRGCQHKQRDTDSGESEIGHSVSAVRQIPIPDRRLLAQKAKLNLSHTFWQQFDSSPLVSVA